MAARRTGLVVGWLAVTLHGAAIEEHLTIYPGTSKTDIRKLGNSDAVDEALKWMVGQERLRVEQDGRAHRHFLVGDEETDE